MFAFPAMYPVPTLRTVGLPLLGIIAVSLAWANQPSEAGLPFMPWWLMLANGILFSWLAVGIHRLVLIDADEVALGKGPQTVASYFAALVVGNVVLSIGLAVLFLRYVPRDENPAGESAMTLIPQWLTWVCILGVLYPLARIALVLPDIALGHGWQLISAWSRSRGNGWRLVLVLFLLPGALELLVELVYGGMSSRLAIAALAVVNAVLTAQSVIALSLSYRELTAMPALLPTPPPG